MQTLFAHNSHLYCTIRYPSAQSLYAAALSIRITSNRKASALGQFWPILFSMFYYIFSRMHFFFFHLLQSTWIFYHIFINQKSIFCTKCAHAGKIRFFFQPKITTAVKSSLYLNGYLPEKVEGAFTHSYIGSIQETEERSLVHSCTTKTFNHSMEMKNSWKIKSCEIIIKVKYQKQTFLLFLPFSSH